MKLFLKGTRCNTARCGIERREYAPGMHGWSRRKVTAYGLHLREKQKVKRYYGILERQFRVIFARAEREQGNTGENLMLHLERRLDNVVTLLGFAESRRDARQMISHGHILINGKRATISSMEVEVGDVITAKNREKSKNAVAVNMASTSALQVPSWLEVTPEPLAGRVVRAPIREDVTLPIQEQLIVELLSK